MEKREFIYQRYILRMGLSLLILLIVEIIQSEIFGLLEISDASIFSCVVFPAVVLVIYYNWSENQPFFLKKGYYWEENGKLVECELATRK